MSIATANHPGEFLTLAGSARALGLPVSSTRELVRRGVLVPARTFPGVRSRFLADDVRQLRQQYERRDATL
jgi:hypothetical protein